MWSIFLFWRCVFRLPNCHSKDISEPTQERCANPITAHYDWPLLNDRDISDKYMITLRNKFNALQEISETITPNEEYEKFNNALMKVAAECIPTKLRAKHRVPWETLAAKKKCDDITAFYAIKENQLMPTLRNLRRHKIN